MTKNSSGIETAPRILKKHPFALLRAGRDMRKTVADFIHQAGAGVEHLRVPLSAIPCRTVQSHHTQSFAISGAREIRSRLDMDG